jgi:hypothetical protein
MSFLTCDRIALLILPSLRRNLQTIAIIKIWQCNKNSADNNLADMKISLTKRAIIHA